MARLTLETATEATGDAAGSLCILAVQPIVYNYSVFHLEALLVMLIAQNEISLSAPSASKTDSGRASRARDPPPSDRVLRPRVNDRAVGKSSKDTSTGPVVTPSPASRKRKRADAEEPTRASGKYPCEVCGESISRERDLRRHHENKHSGQPPQCFRCPRANCNKYLSTQSNVKVHLDTVHTESKHRCDKCDFSCAAVRSFNQHMRKKHPSSFKTARRASRRSRSSK